VCCGEQNPNNIFFDNFIAAEATQCSHQFSERAIENINIITSPVLLLTSAAFVSTLPQVPRASTNLRLCIPPIYSKCLHRLHHTPPHLTSPSHSTRVIATADIGILHPDRCTVFFLSYKQVGVAVGIWHICHHPYLCHRKQHLSGLQCESRKRNEERLRGDWTAASVSSRMITMMMMERKKDATKMRRKQITRYVSSRKPGIRVRQCFISLYTMLLMQLTRHIAADADYCYGEPWSTPCYIYIGVLNHALSKQ
jgi:hypothetical protein